MWERKRQKKPPEDADGGETLLAEIIPFVELEPIVLPERLKKAEKPKETPQKDEEDAKLDNILKDFLIGQDKAIKKFNEISKTHS